MSVSLLDVEFFIQWNLTVKDSSHFASCSVSVKLTLLVGKEASERVEQDDSSEERGNIGKKTEPQFARLGVTP